jgi:hypothetical protein
MNLLLQALLMSVEEAARERDLRSYRIAWKHNQAGQCVIAIVTDDPRLAREKLDPKQNGYRPPKSPR